MRFDIILTDLELYSVDYQIRGEGRLGAMRLEGSLGSREGRWTIQLPRRAYRLSRGSERILREWSFRPYSIERDDGSVGMVWQARQRTGFLNSVEYLKLSLSGRDYALYPLSFGQEGGKSPIYEGERQIAQLEKDAVIYDGKHNYRLFCLDEDGMEIGVLFCAYLYVLGLFKPGYKTISSVSKSNLRTREKFLLDRYDPGFIDRCR